ncbi:MAG: SPASM domain-containing protein, partial [Bacteriovoracaceae bacterium]|nr:SPASM domain-containing protein [Bacteriovoracaceae bacterium]
MKNFKIVEIEINSKCNLSCTYCPNHYNDEVKNEDMGKGTFTTIIGQLKAIDFRGNITFEFYNEPLLSTRLVKFAKQVKRELKDCSIILYTNGTLLDLKYFKVLVAAGIHKFIVTKHEVISSDYKFDYTYSRLNTDEKKMVDYQHHSKIEKTNRAGNIPQAECDKLPYFLPCLIPSSIITIGHNGDIISCFEDFHKTFILGNINEETIDEIWRSPRYIRFRRDLTCGLRF